jgi:hypothetical protein
MTDPKEKHKPVMREAKPKKSLNLSVRLPQLRDPHDELIKPSLPSQTSLTRQTPVAPERDFSKVANSIHREAVPSGLFKGKSKQLYDCLYSLTRGAIIPTRTVRISRPQLMKKAHIGARVTFESNILHLANIGLVHVRQIVGEHEGNEYTVLLPEESMPSLTSQSRYAQKPDILVRLESSQTRHTSTQADTATSGPPKTSFKTKEEISDDDAALAGLNATLKTATKELTGKEVSMAESGRWKELAEVLVAELKIAAARTTVSSVPSFLAEHLRRRLWKIDKKQARAEGRELPDEVVGAPQGALDASSCPDCGGSGWWYPEGEGKGVAKCKHGKLAKNDDQSKV